MKIGIDIGNVIIGGDGEDTTFFTDDYLKTPEVPGAWKSLAKLRRNNELHIISKCGIVVEQKSLKWLEQTGFFYSLHTHRIHFVRKRHLKAPMAQALELDIFIDDRQDVLDHMEGIVKHRILFVSWEQTNKELEEIFTQVDTN
jgi:hypothetical protein